MAKISKRFVLKFNSSIGKVARFTIPRANISKAVDDVEAAMQAIIETGAVYVANRGELRSINGAKTIHTVREVIL